MFFKLSNKYLFVSFFQDKKLYIRFHLENILILVQKALVPWMKL